jgi:hypothetical protein
VHTSEIAVSAWRVLVIVADVSADTERELAIAAEERHTGNLMEVTERYDYCMTAYIASLLKGRAADDPGASPPLGGIVAGNNEDTQRDQPAAGLTS